MTEIRVVLTYHLRTLAKVDGEVQVQAATAREVLDAVEQAHPALRGTMRDLAHRTAPAVRPVLRLRARPVHDAVDEPLPDEVLRGVEPFLVIGAVAGG